MLPLVNEAVAVLREHIVEDADLVDAGVIFGAGFAPFRGGPIQYARTRGVDAIVARLEELQQRSRRSLRTGRRLAIVALSAAGARNRCATIGRL